MLCPKCKKGQLGPLQGMSGTPALVCERMYERTTPFDPEPLCDYVGPTPEPVVEAEPENAAIVLGMVGDIGT